MHNSMVRDLGIIQMSVSVLIHHKLVTTMWERN